MIDMPCHQDLSKKAEECVGWLQERCLLGHCLRLQAGFKKNIDLVEIFVEAGHSKILLRLAWRRSHDPPLEWFVP